MTDVFMGNTSPEHKDYSPERTGHAAISGRASTAPPKCGSGGGGGGGALAGFGGNRSGGHRHPPLDSGEAAARLRRQALLDRLSPGPLPGAKGGDGGGGGPQRLEQCEPREQLRRLARAFESFASHRRKVRRFHSALFPGRGSTDISGTKRPP